ncbi:MAG: hypothetical protein MK291_11120, partial [Planctomycetes bacterium]|nr:hypothetical protein [Planctomycetota bacterium]
PTPRVEVREVSTPRAPRASLPSFTRPTEGGSTAAVLERPQVAVRATGGSPQSAQAPEVGAALSSTEIQSIMSQAGAGCPLGPCTGCPHHEVTTGACKA